MRVVAYCAKRYKTSVKKAASVEPITSPPFDERSFDYRLLETDFVYLKLHGLADQPYFYGDSWITAMSAKEIKGLSLQNTTIFAGNCFLEESKMLRAFLKAGAVVVGGAGLNYAHATKVLGADMLGMWLRRLTRVGFSLERALSLSKKRLWLSNRSRRLAKENLAKLDDALAFKVYRR